MTDGAIYTGPTAGAPGRSVHAGAPVPARRDLERPGQAHQPVQPQPDRTVQPQPDRTGQPHRPAAPGQPPQPSQPQQPDRSGHRRTGAVGADDGVAAPYLTAMWRAIELARLGLGETSPNPSVGCVLLDPRGTVLGTGRTAPVGGPHAEIVALGQAGASARGATAVVTLEPCDHTGRTGPCTRALIEAGVSRVVMAVPDPDPVAAGGAATLRAAGVDVIEGVLAGEAAHDLRYWLTAVRRGRPYLIWKYAATLDGRSAAADGTSKWITSPQARSDVHALRAGLDAIVAGVGTVLADDPLLTVRTGFADDPLLTVRTGFADDPRLSAGPGFADHPPGTGQDAPPADTGGTVTGGSGPGGMPILARRPLRVVVDSAGRTPAGALVRDAAAPTWIATVAELGADLDGHVDLVALLAELYRRGCRGVLLEGGPTLAGAFLRAGLVDEIVCYLAPKLLGAGPAALGPAGVATMADAIDLRITDITRVGPDLRVTAVPEGA